MIKGYFSNRYSKFDDNQKNIVDAGANLAFHHFHEHSENPRIKTAFKEYAKGSLEEKQSLFSRSLNDFAKRAANLPEGMEFSEEQMRNHPNVKWATFAVISEILDIVIPKTVLENFYRFADVKSVGYGDNLVFNVPSNDLFQISTSSNAKRSGQRQKIHGSDIVLTPVNHTITIGEDWYRIVSGKINWGDWVSRVAQSVETQITVDVYNAIYNSFSSLATPYKESGNFAQAPFNQLVQRIQAANRGLAPVAFGTKVGLSKVLPDNQYFQFQLGAEYNNMGFLPNFQGTPLFMFEQRLAPNTDNFAISDDYLFIVSTGLEKIVKIGFEGNTEVYETPMNQLADRSIEYTLQKRWDVKLATAAKFGVWNFAG